MNYINIKTLQTILRHPLISGSSIVFIGSFGASILAYLFNLVVGRILSPAEFGLLTSLTSLTVFFSVFQQAFVGIFAKFSAKYNARNDKNGFSNLIASGTKFVFIFSLVLLALLLVSVPWVTELLKVEDSLLLILIYSAIAFSIMFSLPMGILQGEMQFKTLSFFNLLPQLIKMIIGLSLVILGYGVMGVMVAILVAAVIPLSLGMHIIRKRHTSKKPDSTDTEIYIKEFKSYSLYFLLATLGITVISNMDIVLVRIFFEPEVSGQYAALSLMGKAIYYLTAPIYFVFFPLIAQKKEREETVLQTLLLAVGIVAGISVAVAFGYFLLPNLVISIFFPQYQMLAAYLGPYALFIVIFSIANLFNNYFLSMGNTGVYKINLSVSFIFVVLIALFHSSLYQVIGVLFVASFLLLISYLVYYYQLHHGKN